VPGDVTYYAIVGIGRTTKTPSGLARRRNQPGGVVDEALRRDLSWQRDSAIVEWEHGEVGANLVEISALEAEELTTRFRGQWAEQA
jgi:hypothetical protein